jgi:putative MATE family efflux protein
MVVTEGFGVIAFTVDLIWVGRLGAASIAGVGVASMVSMLIMGANVGIVMGVRATVARLVGAYDTPGANHAATQALVIGIVYGVVMTAAGMVLAEPVLELFGLEPLVVSEGAIYMRIMFAGMLGFSLRITADSIMQASGDTITPMKITILTRSIHLLLAPFIIFGWWVFPRLGVGGAAMANVTAHTLAMVIGLWVLFTGRSRLRLTLSNFHADPSIIWRMVKIGIPACIMSIQRSLSYLVLAWLMVPFGTLAVAAHSIIQRIDTLIFLPTWALGAGAGVLVGQNLGAQQPQRAERSTWLATGFVAIFMLVASAVFLLLAEGIVGIFNAESGLVEIGSDFLRIAVAGYLLTGLTVVFQQAISGAGDTVPTMLISLLMVWVIQLPLAFFLPRVGNLGVYGVRWALVIGIVIGAVTYATYFRAGRWKRKRV